ncbi:hypothetical protein G5B30_01130 [Sphingobacterium sp. SGG-5]|uniref:hypothetical protein n=1 Tax=Sphingobacterium sp. SGG-5 TaxID=2710881 RepID=UPI0013ED46A6|nr:hypothetical protein [Sphingobacterium sp. SGG-5]NGM60506.1 hypothetical protein [Sphingobacterium sp. SGG-5]
MENILVVLVIIGSIIYKMYTGYKEEMEKAAKRKQQQRPPVPTPTQQHPRPQVQQSRPQVVPPRPITPPAQVSVPPAPKRAPTVVSYEGEIPSEVKRVQRQKSDRALKNVTVLEEKKETEKKPFEFDLRQAVIQSAILERPYK